MTAALLLCFLSYLLDISISSKLLGQFGNIITSYRDTFILTQMVSFQQHFIIQQNTKTDFLSSVSSCLQVAMNIGIGH